MEDTTQKIRKEVSDILAEIKASDYMNTITGLGAAVILLSVLYFVSHGEYWLALILTASSPISIVILAVITKMITNRISRLLHPSSEEENVLRLKQTYLIKFQQSM